MVWLMSVSHLSLRTECSPLEIRQDVSHELPDSCGFLSVSPPAIRLGSIVRSLVAANRFIKLFKAKKVQEMDLSALTQGVYQKYNIRVKEASAHELRSILYSWRAQLFQVEVTMSAKEDLDLFEASFQMISGMLTSLNSKNDRFFIAADSNGVVQAIGISDINAKQSIHLSALATAPHNLTFAHSPQQFRVRGGGSAIISHLLGLAILFSRQGLRLYPLDSAISFYEKLGFKRDEEEDFYMPVSDICNRLFCSK